MTLLLSVVPFSMSVDNKKVERAKASIHSYGSKPKKYISERAQLPPHQEMVFPPCLPSAHLYRDLILPSQTKNIKRHIYKLIKKTVHMNYMHH